MTAEVIDTLAYRFNGRDGVSRGEIAMLRNVDTGERFDCSVEACVEVDD